LKLEVLLSCLFFDAPKNNKGGIHYKPLKMTGTKSGFLGIVEQNPKKVLPLIRLRKFRVWLSDEKSNILIFAPIKRT